MRAFCSSLLLACAVPAQGPCTWLHLDGADATAVGVLYPTGFDDDPKGRSGLAAVAAAARLEQGRRNAGALLASGVQVGSDYAIVFAVVGRDGIDAAVAFLEGVRRDGADLDDDVLALAIARAALAADDAEFLYPGDVMRTRARRRIGAGTALVRPPYGQATECIELTPAIVRERLAAPTPVRVAALGAVDQRWIDAVGGIASPADPCAPAAVLVCRPPRRERERTEDVSARADSPYVAVAFAAPPAADRPAFALAMEIARARAFGRFRLRGRELFARAPFVRWSWLRADPLAVFFRRGEDNVQLLPGERPKATVDDEVDATQRELQALLEDLRTVPPTANEMAAARAALRSQLGLPGPGESAPWASEAATLPGRLQVLLLRGYHAIDVAILDSVSPAMVAASMKATLGPARSSWHAMVPRRRDRLGYRRR